MTKAAYKEAVALVERSGLQPTKLVSQKDLDKLRDDQKIESANDSLSNVIDSVITREEFQLDRKKVKNDFYLTPEELEKKALLKFKENHENEKRSIRNPMEAQMLQEAEEEFRATGGHNAQEPGKGDLRYQQMLDMGMVDPGQSYEDWARINVSYPRFAVQCV